MRQTVVISEAPARWLRGILISALLLSLFFAASGFVYQNICETRDRRFNPMPGRLVEVRGKMMHIDCTGTGSPTVIFESGLGDSYISWRQVQPEIANFTRVCSYDRAGLGYSDPSPEPRTSKVIAQQLHELLRAAQVSSPYVLVGHSMGGYNVRLYAALYPTDVVGMVLVDASHPDQENRFPPELKKMEGRWHFEAAFLAAAMPLGIPRLMGMCDEDARSRAADCNFDSAREAVRESRAFQESAVQAAATGPFGDIPLAVLSHDPNKPSSEMPADLARAVNSEWEKMQEDLAHLSTLGTQSIAPNSGHYIQSDRPEMVIHAVQSVVNQARTILVTAQPPHH